MEKREFQTPFGVVPLWGDFANFDASRPLVVGILGAFAIERGSLFSVPPHIAGSADMVVGHLPGNHTPALVYSSVGVFSAAYSHVIANVFSERRVVSLGASIGGLTVLGLRAPQIVGSVVMEPVLTTGKLWPMTAFMREKLLANPQDTVLRDFIVNVFGVTETGLEDRRYEAVLNHLKVPTRVIVGGVPLYPERPVQKLPSLVDEPERELLQRHPMIRYSVAPHAGHNVPQEASEHMLAALREALAEA
jgi:pimeloyl-ACP methyl ester carboxylesterase